MSNPEPDDDKPLDPEQQKIVAKVRWLMLISGFATVLGIAVVIGVIGYRVFRSGGSGPPVEAIALLPKGAKIVATAVTEDRIVVTVEVGGTHRDPHLRPEDAAPGRPPAVCDRAVSRRRRCRLPAPRDRVYFKALAACSLRLAAQDVALSRRKQGFESPRERQPNQGLDRISSDLPHEILIFAL